MTRRAIVVVMDGLRRDLIVPTSTPALHRFSSRAETFAQHRSAFPSTTRVSAASMATGCHPLRHGLLGNVVALRDGGGRLQQHDAGAPDFFTRMRRLTSHTLRVPTLAERLARSGQLFVGYSNVSPGAAYALDPDGHGFIYHRAGSYGPGRRLLEAPEALQVTHDAAGDASMTDRFCRRVLREVSPAVSVLWLCEPDSTQHCSALGSAEHRDAMTAADACAARVMETYATLAGEAEGELLLIICSDHGHQTVAREIDLAGLLVAAGLKADRRSDDVIVAGNGTAALIYLSEDAAHRRDDIARFLHDRDWVGAVFSGDELEKVGLGGENGAGLSFAVHMRDYPDARNEHGIPGLSDAVKDDAEESLGHGQHGGRGQFEQSPFLMIQGSGFAAGATRQVHSSLIDIAPTILRHLGLEAEGMQGQALQRM